MGCMGVRVTDLHCKEVICVCDGSRLGYVSDVEVTFPQGQICAIVVPGKCRFFGLFGSQEEYVISWKNVCRVGDDIILVDCRPCDCRCPRQKQSWFS